MASRFASWLVRRAGGCSTPGRANRGLYHGKKIGSGHIVSFAENRSKRKWNPNVQFKALYSEVLERKIKFRMTTEVIKICDRVGGIDNYLLRLSPKLQSPMAKKWKQKIERKISLNKQKALNQNTGASAPSEQRMEEKAAS